MKQERTRETYPRFTESRKKNTNITYSKLLQTQPRLTRVLVRSECDEVGGDGGV